MKISIAVLPAVICLIAAVAFPSRADVEVVQKTVIDAPGIQQMLKEIPQSQRASLIKMMSPIMTGVPWVTTTYLKGSRLRTDMGDTTVVVNAESGNSFTLNRLSHVYSLGAYDPFQKAAGDMTCRVFATNQTATMLGHPVRRYLVKMTSSILPKSPIAGEIWSATDLPTPPAPGYLDGTSAGIQTEMAKIKGMPLLYSLVFGNTPAGDIRIVSVATKVKEDPLIASVFRIPDDFHQGVTRTATITPSAGYPLGDGMPLDNLNAVTDSMAIGQQGNRIAATDGQSGSDDSSLGGLQGMLGGLSGGGDGGAGGLDASSLSEIAKLLGSLSSGDAGSGLGDSASALGGLLAGGE